MDELSALFQEIEFHDRWRGYDPDEVDAYVDEVAKAAALVRGRMMELHERVTAAESQRGSGGGGEAEDTLTRTLVLAQRTADAAIAEAREEADRLTTDAATSAQAILSATEAEAQLALRGAQAEASALLKESEDRAATVLAEAEVDRRQLVADAESVAAQAAVGQRDRLADEVSELQQYRAFLADDIEILERHLTDERQRLSASLSALTDLLEVPEVFRAARAPETSGVQVEEALLEPDLAAAAVVEESPAEESLVEKSPAEESLVEESPVEEPAVEAELIEEDLVVAELLVEAESAEEELVVEAELVEEDLVVDDEWVEQEQVSPLSFDPQPESYSEFLPPEEISQGEEVTIDLVAAEDGLESESEAEVNVEPVFEAAPARDEVVYATMPEFGGAESVLETTRAPEMASPPLLVTAADFDPVTPAAGFGAGPSTAPVPTITESSLFAAPVDTADDPFLAQLRDAMDGEPVPENDEDALSAFFDHDEDDGSRSWFGRRR